MCSPVQYDMAGHMQCSTTCTVQSSTIWMAGQMTGLVYTTGDAAANGGWDCLNAAGSYSTSSSWYGSLADTKAKCDADNECTVLHDYAADGNNWRACKSVSSGTGAATMVKQTVAPTTGNLYPISYTTYHFKENTEPFLKRVHVSIESRSAASVSTGGVRNLFSNNYVLMYCLFTPICTFIWHYSWHHCHDGPRLRANVAHHIRHQ